MNNPDTTTTPIEIPFPGADTLHLKINVGACRLNIKPGGNAWVSGVYQDPTGSFPAVIEQEGGTARVTQNFRIADLPNIYPDFIPVFDLELGKARPYMLSIDVGANESSYDLGGLPINRLLIKQGAGKAVFDFSAPNPQRMSLLDLKAGAIGIEMKNLANANFTEMSVEGGAAAYSFDFGGVLQQNAHVRINTGMSSVEIRLAATTPAKITAETVLAGLLVGEGFMKKEGAFWNQASLASESPTLEIHVNVTMGSLSFREIS